MSTLLIRASTWPKSAKSGCGIENNLPQNPDRANGSSWHEAELSRISAFTIKLVILEEAGLAYRIGPSAQLLSFHPKCGVRPFRQ
jgi:hypothetical protein